MIENKKPQKNNSDETSLTSKIEENAINEPPQKININKNKRISKSFQEIHKKNLEKLNSSSHPSLRNSVRKTLYEALLNKQEPEGKIP
jgi:hypothetical protein